WEINSSTGHRGFRIESGIGDLLPWKINEHTTFCKDHVPGVRTSSTAGNHIKPQGLSHFLLLSKQITQKNSDSNLSSLWDIVTSQIVVIYFIRPFEGTTLLFEATHTIQFILDTTT
ncbi:hypothetical protein ACJX0J_009433, partial [Zea mays]